MKHIHLFYTHRILPNAKEWRGGTTANEQISWNFFKRATERKFTCSVHYFGDTHIKPADNDIVICHPGPALAGFIKQRRKVHMICPWSAWPGNLEKDGQHVWIMPQFDGVTKIFGLGGSIWKTEASKPDNPYHKWYSKLHLNNMGVHNEKFQNWKKDKFNEPGKRNFLFMGSPTWWKGVNELKAVFKDNPYHLYMCGDGPAQDLAPNIHYLGHIDNNGSQLRSLIQTKIDFYVHMSIFDAQATTILESVAHGLVPVCTPASGYQRSIMLNHTKDIDGNREILDRLQHMPHQDMITKSNECINSLCKEHNWATIVDSIIDVAAKS